MATDTQYNFILLPDALRSVRVSTDYDRLTVKVEAGALRGATAQIYQATLYAYDGEVEFIGLDDIAIEWMRQNGKSVAQISIGFYAPGGSSQGGANFRILYTDYELPDDFHPKETFWTAAPTSRVSPDSAIMLTHYDDDPADLTYRIKMVCEDSDGLYRLLDKTITREASAERLSLSVKQLISTMTDGQDDIARACYFVISHDGYSKTYYIAEDPWHLTFRYRNMFNAPEYVDVTGRLTRKTIAESSTAQSCGKAIQYDRKLSRTYELATGPLTHDQAREIEQLAASYKTLLCDGSDEHEVIITESTCEWDNADESLVTMKLTFRFADAKPRLTLDEAAWMLKGSSGIFTEEFTAEFE